MSNVTTELSVEDALKELREIFPGQAVSIEFRDYSNIGGCGFGAGYVKVSGGADEGVGPTLNEAMAQVRQFTESQKVKEL